MLALTPLPPLSPRGLALPPRENPGSATIGQLILFLTQQKPMMNYGKKIIKMEETEMSDQEFELIR